MRKDLKPTERTVDKCQVTDVDSREISKIKRRIDEIPREKVTTENVTVSRRDIRIPEEPKTSTYRKDLDIGRIVIDEIPEEKEEIPESDIVQRELARAKRTDVTVSRRDVRERPKKYVKEDVVKVGKLDTTDLDRVTEQSWRVEERAKTEREIIDGRKVGYHSHIYELYFPQETLVRDSFYRYDFCLSQQAVTQCTLKSKLLKTN